MLTSTVIICTRNRYQDILHCLESLACQSRPADQLLIVDASDDDYLGAIVPAIFPHAFSDCRVVHSAPGLTHQRNLGASLSRGDVVFYFDDDVVLDADYLSIILRTLERDSTHRYAGGMGQIVGMVAARGLDRVLQRVFFLGEVFGTGRFKPSGFPSLPHGQTKFLEIETLSGCAMTFRREILASFPFDEALTGYAYVDDDDMARRISLQHGLFYEPTARVEHRVSTQGRMWSRANRRMLLRHQRYVFRKNFPQTPGYIIPHMLSILGILVNDVVHHDLRGVVGALEGIFSPMPTLR